MTKRKEPKYKGCDQCDHGWIGEEICSCVLDSIEKAEWGTYRKDAPGD